MNKTFCILAISLLIASVSSSGVIGKKSERVKALSRAVQNRINPLAQQSPSQFQFVPITRSNPPAIASMNSAVPMGASAVEQQQLQDQIMKQQQLIQSAHSQQPVQRQSQPVQQQQSNTQNVQSGQQNLVRPQFQQPLPSQFQQQQQPMQQSQQPMQQQQQPMQAQSSQSGQQNLVRPQFQQQQPVQQQQQPMQQSQQPMQQQQQPVQQQQQPMQAQSSQSGQQNLVRPQFQQQQPMQQPQQSQQPQQPQQQQQPQQPQQPSVRQQNGDFCKSAQPGEIIPHPSNSNQFVICYGFGEFTVMACPAHLIYNHHLQRCDLHKDEPNMCASNPCANKGKCVELGSSFRCECPAGFTGRTCERDDSCTTNPCGSSGFCLTTQHGSSLGHICLCNGGRNYGSNCQQTEANPCLNPGSNFKMFPSSLGPNVFVHCEGARPHFQFCQAPLIFSSSKQACDWN